MALTVLSVAHPFSPVGPDAVGGAEQMLTRLDEALEASGHRSIVVACEGSQTAGTLIPTAYGTGTLDGIEKQAYASHRHAIREALRRFPVDLVHMHGVDFREYLPEAEVPVLVTLHLPAARYKQPVWPIARPKTYLHCLSAPQRRAFGSDIPFLPDIHNGVPYERLQSRLRKRNYALALGRVLPEKRFPVAIGAAVRAGVSLLIGGDVLAYAAHEEYFEKEIVPRLDPWRRFLGPVGFARKRRLLTSAKCVLIPSREPEPSSLVAMESLACGTPVIGFAVGAMPEIIDHGRTGYLVENEREMSDAILRAEQLSSEVCRTAARERFSLARTIPDYLLQYERAVAQARLGL